jgi:putative ABC transport system substrate-binding protein
VTDSFARASGYVAKILKGANAAELPFEQSSEVELVVNLKAAKTLGVTIPSSIMLRANKAIE